MFSFKPHIFVLAGVFWFSSSVLSQQTPPPPLLPAASVSVKSPNETSGSAVVSEKIHFGDLIDVDVVGSIEYDWRGTLTPEGFLKGIDFVEEPVYALCQTEETVARQIEKSYGKFLREPKVTVRILDRSGRPTSVVYGAVKTPQRFQIRRPARLSELIILSGGLTERASGEIQIFRSQNMSCEAAEAETKSKETTAGASEGVERRERFVATRRGGEDGDSTYINVSIADLLKGKPEANPIILTGDIVTIQEAAPIYVIGGVAAPKQISARGPTNVARAVAAAGGPTRDANPKKVTIFRRQAAETKIIEVDLEAVNAGKAEDVPLRAFDVVEVSLRGRDNRKFPPVLRAPETDEKNILNLPLRVVE